MAIFQAKAFQTVTSSTSGLSRIKKLASNVIKKNQPFGKPNSKGYKEAIDFLQSYNPNNELEALDIQGLILGYENKLTVLEIKKRDQGRSLGEFKNTEREIYFKIPLVNASGEFKEAPYDIPLRVSEIALDLTELRFSIEDKIREGGLTDEDVSTYEGYLAELKVRQEIMVDLNNDYLEGTISPQLLRETVGIYTESDNEDGEVRNVGIMPIDNFPPGIDKNKFRRLEDTSSAYGDGYLQEFGNFIKGADGVARHRQGVKVWDDGGSGDDLTYNRSSDRNFNNKPGTFQRQESPFKIAGFTPGKFSRGVAGTDENGITQWATFYRGKDDAVYRLDDETLERYNQDPNFASDIKNASTIYDTELSLRMMNNEDVKPLTFTPLTAGIEARNEARAEEERLAPARAEAERRKQVGFFGRLGEDLVNIPQVGLFGASIKTLSGFFNRKNRLTPPEESSRTQTTPEIIDKGRIPFAGKDNLK